MSPSSPLLLLLVSNFFGKTAEKELHFDIARQGKGVDELGNRKKKVRTVKRSIVEREGDYSHSFSPNVFLTENFFLPLLHIHLVLYPAHLTIKYTATLLPLRKTEMTVMTERKRESVTWMGRRKGNGSTWRRSWMDGEKNFGRQEMRERERITRHLSRSSSWDDDYEKEETKLSEEGEMKRREIILDAVHDIGGTKRLAVYLGRE